MISESLATILRSNRTEFNARFAEARRRFPSLSGEQFTVVLEELVDPVVAAVAACRPDCTVETASVAYDCALELAGQNLAGPGARSRAIAEGWLQLLPAAANHLAEVPRSVLPAVSNALHHLSVTPGASPERWVRAMAALSGQCLNAAEFLQAGQAAAGRAGLAHYREPALAILSKLPPTLAREIMGVPEQAAGTDPAALLARLGRDRWYDPARPRQEEGQLRAAGRIGAFRGFGGLFLVPPTVTVANDSLLVQSGTDCWILTADCFGATLHRADPATIAAAPKNSPLPEGLSLAGSAVRRDGATLDFGRLGGIASAAATVDTLAITTPLSHGVLLVALT